MRLRMRMCCPGQHQRGGISHAHAHAHPRTHSSLSAHKHMLRVWRSAVTCAQRALAAAGVYSIVLHGKRDTHLLYRLEVPEEPGEVQRALRIAKEGKMLVSVKSAPPWLTPQAGSIVC